MDELKKISLGKPLSEEEAYAVFERIMGEGEITDAQIGAYLFSTSTRNLTANELVGGARSLRKHVASVDVQNLLLGVELLDTCGTGGSGLDTFNTSTASAFVVAASGQPVAKHGNRGATSKCGSADVLAALGVNLDIAPERVAECIVETNFGFMFAPNHHPATKRVVGIRKQIAVRNIFNFLGPLTNPAGAKLQVLGVSSEKAAPVIAEALQRLGATRAMVVAGVDGLDEITVCAKTKVFEISSDEIKTSEISPEDFSLPLSNLAEIKGSDPEPAAEDLRAVLSGLDGAKRHLLLLNAGAALYLAGKSDTLSDGVNYAARLIDSGAAIGVLDRVIEFTNQ